MSENFIKPTETRIISKNIVSNKNNVSIKLNSKSKSMKQSKLDKQKRKSITNNNSTWLANRRKRGIKTKDLDTISTSPETYLKIQNVLDNIEPTISKPIENYHFKFNNTKDIKRKKTLLTQLIETKSGRIDLKTPSSILTKIDIKGLINRNTFDSLPYNYQIKLIHLLPECDREYSENGTLKNCALNNEFIKKSCIEWQQSLTNGDFNDINNHYLSKQYQSDNIDPKLTIDQGNIAIERFQIKENIDIDSNSNINNDDEDIGNNSYCGGDDDNDLDVDIERDLVEIEEVVNFSDKLYSNIESDNIKAKLEKNLMIIQNEKTLSNISKTNNSPALTNTTQAGSGSTTAKFTVASDGNCLRKSLRKRKIKQYTDYSPQVTDYRTNYINSDTNNDKSEVIFIPKITLEAEKKGDLKLKIKRITTASANNQTTSGTSVTSSVIIQESEITKSPVVCVIETSPKRTLTPALSTLLATPTLLNDKMPSRTPLTRAAAAKLTTTDSLMSSSTQIITPSTSTETANFFSSHSQTKTLAQIKAQLAEKKRLAAAATAVSTLSLTADAQNNTKLSSTTQSNCNNAYNNSTLKQILISTNTPTHLTSPTSVVVANSISPNNDMKLNDKIKRCKLNNNNHNYINNNTNMNLNSDDTDSLLIHSYEFNEYLINDASLIDDTIKQLNQHDELNELLNVSLSQPSNVSQTISNLSISSSSSNTSKKDDIQKIVSELKSIQSSNQPKTEPIVQSHITSLISSQSQLPSSIVKHQENIQLKQQTNKNINQNDTQKLPSIINIINTTSSLTSPTQTNSQQTVKTQQHVILNDNIKLQLPSIQAFTTTTLTTPTNIYLPVSSPSNMNIINPISPFSTTTLSNSSQQASNLQPQQFPKYSSYVTPPGIVQSQQQQHHIQLQQPQIQQPISSNISSSISLNQSATTNNLINYIQSLPAIDNFKVITTSATTSPTSPSINTISSQTILKQPAIQLAISTSTSPQPQQQQQTQLQSHQVALIGSNQNIIPSTLSSQHQQQTPISQRMVSKVNSKCSLRLETAKGNQPINSTGNTLQTTSISNTTATATSTSSQRSATHRSSNHQLTVAQLLSQKQQQVAQNRYQTQTDTKSQTVSSNTNSISNNSSLSKPLTQHENVLTSTSFAPINIQNNEKINLIETASSPIQLISTSNVSTASVPQSLSPKIKISSHSPMKVMQTSSPPPTSNSTNVTSIASQISSESPTQNVFITTSVTQNFLTLNNTTTKSCNGLTLMAPLTMQNNDNQLLKHQTPPNLLQPQNTLMNSSPQLSANKNINSLTLPTTTPITSKTLTVSQTSTLTNTTCSINGENQIFVPLSFTTQSTTTQSTPLHTSSQAFITTSTSTQSSTTSQQQTDQQQNCECSLKPMVSCLNCHLLFHQDCISIEKKLCSNCINLNDAALSSPANVNNVSTNDNINQISTTGTSNNNDSNSNSIISTNNG